MATFSIFSHPFLEKSQLLALAAKGNITIDEWSAHAPTARAMALSCRNLRNTALEHGIALV